MAAAVALYLAGCAGQAMAEGNADQWVSAAPRR
jgi:hypothetical protein